MLLLLLRSLLVWVIEVAVACAVGAVVAPVVPVVLMLRRSRERRDPSSREVVAIVPLVVRLYDLQVVGR